MLVVGASLARAFGVVGVAGLVRYRAKINDPKDAGVMLATLGRWPGVGRRPVALALFATALLHRRPVAAGDCSSRKSRRTFLLTVKSKEAAKLEPAITQVLRRHRAKVELRSSAPDEVSFELRLPHRTEDR